MNYFRMFSAVVILPLFLAACQTAQVGSSSYAGNALTQKPVKKSVTPNGVNPFVAGNDAASLVVKKMAAAKIEKPTTVAAKSAPKKSKKKISAKSRYRSIIARHAKAQGVPIKLAMAVVQVESNYKANARGRAGEIGLMQLMPRTARFIGYKGSMKNLYNPETNIQYGMKYLGKAHRLGKGNVCGTILKYNAGHGAKRMNKISRKYCKRVRRIMRNG